jgi:hypothetical protein
MKMLRKGDRGPEVGLLRRLLNKKLTPSPNLPEANVFGARYNGAMATIDFGPKMQEAVRLFQRSKRLDDDGIVGPKTWGALGLTTDVNQQVTLSAQPDSVSCYAAAATMVLGPGASMSYQAGTAPPNVKPDDYWAEKYSLQFNWKLEYGQTPTPGFLSSLLRRGPLWMAGTLPFPNGPSYHAVVIGALWGDGAGDSTMLLIYDPWPVNAGEVYGIILNDYLQQNPLSFRYILHK